MPYETSKAMLERPAWLGQISVLPMKVIMDMKSLLFLLLLMGPLRIFAQDNRDQAPHAATPAPAAKASKKSSTCPDGKNLANICMAIGSAEKSRNPRYQFHYQEIIMQAACVSDSDDEESTSKKVQKMWTQYEDKLICNNTRFDVIDGNMLKFAASARFEDFLFDAAMIWKVDLNRVDPGDGRTVLDYVQKELDKYKGTAIEPKLRSYFDMLRSSGAKFSSEL